MLNIQKQMMKTMKSLKLQKIEGMDFRNITHNRYILYFFLLLSLIDLFYFATVKDTTSIILFILVAVLTSFFSKNMIAILFVALIVTHIVKYGTTIAEGMENEEKKEEKDEKEEKEEKDEKEEKKEEKLEKEGLQDFMKNDVKEFMETQNKILAGMAQLEPLMTKAEGFIEKFEKYKNTENK